MKFKNQNTAYNSFLNESEITEADFELRFAVSKG